MDGGCSERDADEEGGSGGNLYRRPYFRAHPPKRVYMAPIMALEMPL